MYKCVKLVGIGETTECVEALNQMGWDSGSAIAEINEELNPLISGDLNHFIINESITSEKSLGWLIRVKVLVPVGGVWYVNEVTACQSVDGYWMLEDDIEDCY